MTRIHDLKTHADVWDAVYRGDKTAELRKDDRDFQEGDWLHLIRGRAWSSTAWQLEPIMLPDLATGGLRPSDPLLVIVTHKLTHADLIDAMGAYGRPGDVGMLPGWCMLSFRRL